MSLVNEVRDLMVKGNLGEEFTPPVVSTGIDVLDYRNGKFSRDDLGVERIITGVDVGKNIMIIGKSGTAKTTLAVQVAKAIIDPFEDGYIQHQDFERATSDERLMSILGLQTLAELKQKVIRPLKNLNTETTFELIKQLVAKKDCTVEKSKLKGKELAAFQNPYMVQNLYNRQEQMIVPTALLIDSLATMMPKKVDEDDQIAGNMSAASVAKVNTSFFKGLLGDFIDGAIVPIIINHLTTKISINRFNPVTAEISWLKPDESLIFI